MPRNENTAPLRRPRFLKVAGSVLGLVLGIAPVVTSATGVEAAAACPGSAFIGVRGSFEAAGTGTSASGASYASGGFGGQVSAIIKDFQAVRPDWPMKTYGIKYPAAVVPVFNDTNYLASKDAGAKALIKEINHQAATCPSANTWLAGYSQGADVIGQVLSAPTSNQLSARAQRVLNGVILMGDPSYRTTERINSKMNTGKGAGATARGRTTGSMDGWTGNSFAYGAIPLVRSYCYSKDLIYQLGSTTSTTVHNSYNKDELLLRDAENFLWEFVLSPQRLANKATLAQN